MLLTLAKSIIRGTNLGVFACKLLCGAPGHIPPLECNRICAPPVPKIDPGIMGENRQPLPLGCFPAFRFFFFFIEHILGFEIICYWLLISFLATVQLIFQSVVSVSHMKIIPGFLTNRVMFHVISFAFISSSFLV